MEIFIILLIIVSMLYFMCIICKVAKERQVKDMNLVHNRITQIEKSFYKRFPEDKKKPKDIKNPQSELIFEQNISLDELITLLKTMQKSVTENKPEETETKKEEVSD